MGTAAEAVTANAAAADRVAADLAGSWGKMTVPRALVAPVARVLVSHEFPGAEAAEVAAGAGELFHLRHSSAR